MINLKNKNKRLFLIVLILVSVATGCSSVKVYPNNIKKNMTIKTSTTSNSILQDVNTYLHVYTLGKKCKPNFLGSLKLVKQVTSVGLPVNKDLFLDFLFVKEGTFSSSSSRTSEETLLRLRRGESFEVDAFYEDDIYDIAIWKRKSKRSKKRKYKLIPYEACTAKLKK